VGLPVGKRGQLCPVCQTGIIKTQDSNTCSVACGVSYRQAGTTPAGVELRIPLSKFRIPVRQEAEASAARAELQGLVQAAKQAARKFPVIKRAKQLSGLLLELNICDAHFGKLCWDAESGHGSYDVAIATNRYRQALTALLARSASYKLDKILFVVGNDFFNADTLNGTTTAGTIVTTDARIQKTFRRGRELMCEAIERLRQLAPVDVVIVPGNHDRLSAWSLGESLDCYFHNCADVSVDNRPLPRKYYQHGKVLIGLTHGDGVKRGQLPLLMATEAPLAFGESLYREIHTGHMHQVRLEESNGVRVRILPTLGNPDQWHNLNGFVGNQLSAESYLWSASDGLIATFHYNVPQEASK
jgi:hypothetical protein